MGGTLPVHPVRVSTSVPAMDSVISYELRDRVAIITIDDGKANAISLGLATDLLAALQRAKDEAGAIVIAGRPGRFSAGFDLAAMTSSDDVARQLLGIGFEIATEIHQCPVPVVLASTGHALAMGAILLLAADVRVGAAGTYKIGLNEVAIGMPVPQLAVELARRVLDTRAFNSSINLAVVHDPESAVAAGFYDMIVPDEQVIDTAIARATELAATLHAGAFATTRATVRGGYAAEMRGPWIADLATFTVAKPDA